MICRPGILLLAMAAKVHGFASPSIQSTKWIPVTNSHEQLVDRSHSNLLLFGSSTSFEYWNTPDPSEQPQPGLRNNLLFPVSLISLATIAALPEEAAAAGSYDVVVPSALVAYAHYAALLVSTAAIITERCTINTVMSVEQEKTLLYADVINQVALLIIGLSGYLRVVEYGKGWEFYCHEPLFWVKVAFFGIVQATSLFPTIHIVKRAAVVHRSDGNQAAPVLSDELVDRMKQLMNAELHSLLTIPIVATFMARGIWYMDDFPWQAGAVGAAATFAGFAFRYSREAMTWTDPQDSTIPPPALKES